MCHQPSKLVESVELFWDIYGFDSCCLLTFYYFSGSSLLQWFQGPLVDSGSRNHWDTLLPGTTGTYGFHSTLEHIIFEGLLRTLSFQEPLGHFEFQGTLGLEHGFHSPLEYIILRDCWENFHSRNY